VAVEPLREEDHQHVMRLLAALGQPGAALRQFKEYERLLDEDTGEEPSAPLRALARQIEKESGLAAPAAPAPARPVRSTPAAVTNAAAAAMRSPSTVTFLLTDVEGSTRTWERTGSAFQAALEAHHRLLRTEFTRHGGQEAKEAGDSFLVSFAGAGQALACAVACQQALAGHPWPEGAEPLLVRMAIHTGDIEIRDGEYYGLALHRASPMLSAAHGGQVLVSEATAAVVRRDLGDEVRLVDLGVYRLRDVPTPEHLFQADFPGMARTQFGPLNAEAGHASGLPLRFTRFFGREPNWPICARCCSTILCASLP
jgi:class 3 adenylate cyclase